MKSAKTLRECRDVMQEWSKFFRSGHIWIELLVQEKPDSSQNVSQAAKEIDIPETWKVDIPKFEKYISKKKEVDYEGIWEVGDYKIGIQKDGANYIGFIIETEVEEWKQQGLVKLKLEQDGDNVKSTYYMRDYSPEESEGKPEWIGNNFLQISDFTLTRLSPVFPDDPFVENYVKSISTWKPYLEKLNETTLYLRIPSFDFSEKSAIDSVLSANKDIILKTKNLIIDLRGNGGGFDSSFEGLLPFLYTNPIRRLGMVYLSTSLNNQRMLDFANTTEYDFNEETRQWSRESYDTLQSRLGEFVNVGGQEVYIDTLDTVYEYPKNVGIIIHKENGSTTEQFLLAAKQSKKVKLFGVSTWGCIDTGNQYSVESPCKEFKLFYSLSRSLRVPDMIIDDIGIQPDYYLDKTIPQYKWVEFVNDVLNQ